MKLAIRSKTRSVRPSVLAAMAVCLATWLAGQAAIAQSRGPLVILGLRAPDGDDDPAANVTGALRRAARAAGFDVPNDSPALEQSMAAFACDDSLPPECLTQIAGDLHAEHVVYGSVRRHGHGASAQLTIQVNLFENGMRNTTARAEAEVARAMAQDSDSLNQTARRLMQTLEPPPAASSAQTTTTGTTTTSGSTNSQSGAQHAAPSQANSSGGSGTPPRRYIAYGALGLGAVMAVVAIGFGIAWGTLGGDSVYQNYMPNVTSYSAICDAAGHDPSSQGVHVAGVCQSATLDSTLAWTLGAIGIVFIAGGAALLLTEPAAPSTSAHAHRRAPPRFSFAPVVTPTYQGAALGFTF